MKQKYIIGIVALIILISGCARIISRNEGEVSPELDFNNSYEGQPVVGNVIFVKFVASPYYDHPANLFYMINWSEQNISASPDLFEIDSSRIEIIKEEKKVTINVPVRILKDGKGFVLVEAKYEGVSQGSSVLIETEGYVPPEQPELPDYCKNLTEEEGRRVGCAVEVK